MIHQIFLLAHDWSKCFTLTNITYLKLGDIQGYHPSNTPQLSNLKSTAISLRLKFNSRWKSVFCLLDERKYFFFHKIIPENTRKRTSHAEKKQFSIFNFPFHIPIPNSPCPTLHSTFPFPTPSPIPHSQSHSPVPFPSPIPQSHSPLPILAFSNIVLCKGHVIWMKTKGIANLNDL